MEQRTTPTGNDVESPRAAPIVEAVQDWENVGRIDLDQMAAALWASEFWVPCDDTPELLARTVEDLGVWLCVYTSEEHMAVGEGIVEDDPNFGFVRLGGEALFGTLLLGQSSLPVTGVWVNLASAGEQISVPLAGLANHLDKEPRVNADPTGENATRGATSG